MVRESVVNQDMATQAPLKEFIEQHIRYSLGKQDYGLSQREWFQAIALATRDRLVDAMLDTETRYEKVKAKRLYYLSLEFLIGRSLGNNLDNLGIRQMCIDTLKDFDVNLAEVQEAERDAALGNGGLGRLAACFLDSLATLGMPGFGYGINYEYGLFRQEIDNGYQVEKPDNWLSHGTPWQIERPEDAVFIPIYGRVESSVDRHGAYNPMWLDWKVLIGVPHDMPIVGHGGHTVNYLRLYSARSSQDFDMQIFNHGDYIQAVQQKIATETISKVLYPSDSVEAGRELRLTQEYFLVACAIRDIVRRYRKDYHNFDDFSSQVAIQLNDTHPALSVAELMRVLIDENDLEWDKAWEITQATLGYTNHTLMPEALEKWSVPLFETLLPRHLQIIYQINQQFMEVVTKKWPGDLEKESRVSLIEEGRPKQVRMAHLSILGSHSVNGVSELHSNLVKTQLVPEFYELFPERFNNKTNGVTQRRWLLQANPKLGNLLLKTLGSGWITDLNKLRGLEKYAGDSSFQEEFQSIKRINKERLGVTIHDRNHVSVNPDSLFDVHIKRIHEYKRQLLKVMHIIHEYLLFVEDGKAPTVPRTYVFAGKAAPGYWAAKQIIKLINNVGQVINHDARVGDMMKVVFVPDYRVTLAEQIIPAADLSEQISTAGTEASGTSNMKFAMNGGITMGTWDGANIEIFEEVGEGNYFTFGLRAEKVHEMEKTGSYRPRDHYANPDVKRVVDALGSNLFSPREPGLFRWIYDALLEKDTYFHLADLPAYLASQGEVGQEFKRREIWQKKAIMNVARSGKFSSDRTIRQYADEIWDIKPVL